MCLPHTLHLIISSVQRVYAGTVNGFGGINTVPDVDAALHLFLVMLYYLMTRHVLLFCTGMMVVEVHHLQSPQLQQDD